MTKGQVEKRSRKRIRPQMAISDRNAASDQADREDGPAMSVEGEFMQFQTSLRPASRMAGNPSRKEMRAASSRLKPSASAR